MPVERPAAPKQLTCRDGIAEAFPPELQEQAIIVMTHENRSEATGAVGALNNDGSRDYGCFQINNFAHPEFFQSSNWQDPVQNAQEAYKIYAGRGNWTAWYSVQGILW